MLLNTSQGEGLSETHLRVKRGNIVKNIPFDIIKLLLEMDVVFKQSTIPKIIRIALDAS